MSKKVSIELTQKDVELVLDGLHELFMTLSETPSETVDERNLVSNLHARFGELLKK